MSAMKHSASCKLRNGACESKLSSAKQAYKSIEHARRLVHNQTTSVHVTTSVAARILMILFHAAGSWSS